MSMRGSVAGGCVLEDEKPAQKKADPGKVGFEWGW
jgi:hypothetical protein